MEPNEVANWLPTSAHAVRTMAHGYQGLRKVATCHVWARQGHYRVDAWRSKMPLDEPRHLSDSTIGSAVHQDDSGDGCNTLPRHTRLSQTALRPRPWGMSVCNHYRHAPLLGNHKGPRVSSHLRLTFRMFGPERATGGSTSHSKTQTKIRAQETNCQY